MHRTSSLIALATITAGLITVSPQPTQAAPDPTPKGWDTYVNTKYDFDICYPSTLQAQTPAPAGDGQKFTGPGGGTLTVFWRPGTQGDTLANTAANEVAGMGAAPAITYTVDRKTFAVRSGKSDNAIFYVKVIQRDADYLVMDAQYPVANAKAWNPMVGHFAACFESSRPH